MRNAKDIQFYFIEDQEHEIKELKEYKQLLYKKGYIINTLIIAKDIKEKDEALLKLIDCNLTENKNRGDLFIVCGGTTSLYLLNKLNFLSYDGMITFNSSNLNSINLSDFNYLSNYATKKIVKDNWKTYFSVIPQSVNYIKNYWGARSNLKKGNKAFKLIQVKHHKEKNYYDLYLLNNESTNNDAKLKTIGKFKGIEYKEELFSKINEYL